MTITMRRDEDATDSTITIEANGESLSLTIATPTYADLLDAHLDPNNTGDRYRKAIARATGWSDVVDQDGSAVAFSTDRLKELFAGKPELFRAFHSAIEDRIWGDVSAKKKQPTESEPSVGGPTASTA